MKINIQYTNVLLINAQQSFCWKNWIEIWRNDLKRMLSYNGKNICDITYIIMYYMCPLLWKMIYKSKEMLSGAANSNWRMVTHNYLFIQYFQFSVYHCAFLIMSCLSLPYHCTIVQYGLSCLKAYKIMWMPILIQLF